MPFFPSIFSIHQSTVASSHPIASHGGPRVCPIVLPNTNTPRTRSRSKSPSTMIAEALAQLPDPDILPPPRKRKSNRLRRRAKTLDFPIPTPPELKEWADRNRQVRIALPISDTQHLIVAPYSDEQDPPLMVSSCSNGTGSPSSDDGPSTPDSDQSQGDDSPGLGYFRLEHQATNDTQVENDVQDEDEMFFIIGRKSTSSLRVPYRCLGTVKEEAEIKEEEIIQKGEKVKQGVEIKGDGAVEKDGKAEEEFKKVVDVELEVEEIRAKDRAEDTKVHVEIESEVLNGMKVVERPAQTLPSPEWTGGREWRKVRAIGDGRSGSMTTFDVQAWAAAGREKVLAEEKALDLDRSDPDSTNTEMWRDIGKLTSLAMVTYMIFRAVARLQEFVFTGFDVDLVEWLVVGSSFAFFVASVCGMF